MFSRLVCLVPEEHPKAVVRQAQQVVEPLAATVS